ncbi:rhamnan synthesis F family protein [Microbacterium sp. NPDC091313]
MTESLVVPGVFPVGGRRLVIYVVYDRRGEVDDYVLHALSGLREHADRILVVVNGKLTDEGRSRLVAVSDEILVRENVGFDIWAHKEALDHVGDTLGEFDEVVLTNDTWFGPVRPYGPVFERMGGRGLHFWGMTDHERQVPNPFTGKGVLPYHLQSFWIAVRREMFLSAQWRSYWDSLPEMSSYFDAVLKHEIVFTEHFTTRGFIADVAFGYTDYDTVNPSLFNADALVLDGCPTLKRRPLFHYPPFLDRHAVIGREILRDAESTGFPVELIWQNLSRHIQPKVVNTNAGALEVKSEHSSTYDENRPLRLAAVVHIDRMEGTEELFSRLAMLPKPVALFVTTDEVLRDSVTAAVARRSHEFARCEVREATVRAGRDMSAYFIDCADVVDSDDYDLVIKLHTRLPRHRSANASRYFRRYQFESLVSSPGYVRNVIGMFQSEQGLGVVFPPLIHIGYATLGQGWSWYRERAAAIAKELDIRVPFDGVTPLAPLGGMWIARPAALRLLNRRGWEAAEYSAHQKSKMPDLARVQERLVAYAVGELGFHVRTVTNAHHAELSHLALEYKLDQLASTTPGYPVEQIQFFHRAGWVGIGKTVAFIRMYMKTNHPRAVERVDPVMHPIGLGARAVLRVLRAVRATVGGRGRSGERPVSARGDESD